MTKTLNPKPELDAQEIFSLISNEKLLAIYAAMVKCRMLEQRATALFQQGKLDADFHASAGREATAAAVAIDLRQEDTLSIAPGDWLPAFAKGMALESLFRALAPAAVQNGTSPAALAEHKNILVPSSNASQPDTVRERAANAFAQNKGAIVVAFLAPEPGSLKPWQKTMAAAAAKKHPIVFVHYVEPLSKAIRTRENSGSKSKLRHPEALVYGVPAIAVDALDAVAVYRVAYEAIVRARQARGATLLQCTLHFGPATIGIDAPSADETLVDAVSAMETYLKRKGIEPELHNRSIVAAFHPELDLATRFLKR